MRARKEKRNSCIDARSSRASSVQRQTETLRTLGTRREVGSKLHSNPDITSLYSGTSRAASPYRDTGRRMRRMGSYKARGYVPRNQLYQEIAGSSYMKV